MSASIHPSASVGPTDNSVTQYYATTNPPDNDAPTISSNNKFRVYENYVRLIAPHFPVSKMLASRYMGN